MKKNRQLILAQLFINELNNYLFLYNIINNKKKKNLSIYALKNINKKNFKYLTNI